MKILITGASGFVGKYLLKELKKTEHELVILYRGKVGSILAGNEERNCQYIDIKEANWMELVQASQPEMAIHLAAHLTSADDRDAIQQLVDGNILYGTQLLSALKNTPLRYFIHTGTFAEYHSNDYNTDPAYLYAAMKTAFRSVMRYYQTTGDFRIINIIPFTIYGGIDTKKKLIDYIYDSTRNDDKIKMSPGEQVLDFIHIDDVVGLYLSIVEQISQFKEPYTELRLGTGNGTTPRQIANLIEELTGRKTNIEWGGLPYRKKDTMYSVADRNLPSEYISWVPAKDIKQGLKEYINIIEKK
jgi:CDP-paratose synthetase